MEEYKLHLLTHKLTHAGDDSDTDPEPVNHEVDGPLGEATRLREEGRRIWENGNCRIRPFRPFSAGIGKRRAVSDEDRLFLTYAPENSAPAVYVWRNPKREMTKLGECESYKRYERYKDCTTLRDVISISLLSRPKGMTENDASALAMRDIKWDYERGYIYFPLNESGRLGHWIDAKVMAADRGAQGEAMVYSGEDGPTALSSIVIKAKRPKMAKAPSQSTERKALPCKDRCRHNLDHNLDLNELSSHLVLNDEAETFNEILSEVQGEDQVADAVGEDPMAMMTTKQTFGDVLDKQYDHDKSEW